MIVFIHVIIALASVLFSSITFFKSSIKKLVVSYGLIVATVASGTFLIITTPGDMLKSCLTGLLYVTVVSIITIAAHVRFNRMAEVHTED